MDQPIEILQQANLDKLLVGLVRSIAEAQDTLDADAAHRAAQKIETPSGIVELPPLWHTITNAAVEIQLSAAISESGFLCRLVNPNSVSLFGYEASAGMRVRLQIAPHGAPAVK